MSFSKQQNFFFILALIFILNLVFKLIYIGYPSLWYDEIISVQDTLLDFGHIKHEAEWDKNPPFYHYVLWVWSKLFGISEFAVRSMSAFFSSLAAVLIYVLINKISSARNAILGVIIFSFHPFMYYYAQEARCFSFLIFLVISNLMLTRSFYFAPSYYKAFSLGVLNFLIFYTHYLAGIILFCQFVFIAIAFRKEIMFLVLIYVTPILLVLIRFTRKQYNVLFFSQKMSKEKSNVPLADLNCLAEALDRLFVSRYFVIIYLVLLIIFLYRQFWKTVGKISNEIKLKLFIAISPVVCILILYLLGMWTNVFHERYLIYTLPLLIISSVVMIERKWALLGYALLFTLFEIHGLKFKQSKGMDYRFCATLTKKIQSNEDVIVLIQTHDVVNLFTYYYDKETFYSKNRMSHEYLKGKGIYYIDQLDDIKNISFDEKKAILFFQTYQKFNDNILIETFFESKKYFRFTTKQIEGVKFNYLKKIEL